MLIAHIMSRYICCMMLCVMYVVCYMLYVV